MENWERDWDSVDWESDWRKDLKRDRKKDGEYIGMGSGSWIGRWREIGRELCEGEGLGGNVERKKDWDGNWERNGGGIGWKWNCEGVERGITRRIGIGRRMGRGIGKGIGRRMGRGIGKGIGRRIGREIER